MWRFVSLMRESHPCLTTNWYFNIYIHKLRNDVYILFIKMQAASVADPLESEVSQFLQEIVVRRLIFNWSFLSSFSTPNINHSLCPTYFIVISVPYWNFYLGKFYALFGVTGKEIGVFSVAGKWEGICRDSTITGFIWLFSPRVFCFKLQMKKISLTFSVADANRCVLETNTPLIC